jgi:drug/metabolite transporter (DMT)-like permease
LSFYILAAVLLGALCHATWNAVVKAQPNRSIASEVVAVLAGLSGIPIIIALPPPAPEAWPYLLTSSFIHIGYFALVGFTYRTADLGVAYPLTRGSAPLLTTIAALVLIGETPSTTGWLAVLAIAGGIATLSIDALHRGGLTRSAGLAVITNAFVIMTYTMIDGLGTRVSGNSLAYVGWLITLTSLWVLILTSLRRGKRFYREAKKVWLPCLIASALILPSYGIALWAMTRAPIGLVAALRETAVLFAAVIGTYFFKEKFGPRRWLAVIAIITGIILLKLPAN